MKQIEVKIMQQSYLLSCPEGQESRMLNAVERVDAAMTRIRDAGKVRARERIAVLTALNLAYQRAEMANQPAPLPSPALAVADGEMDVEHLIRRIDGALGHDGQLL